MLLISKKKNGFAFFYSLDASVFDQYVKRPEVSIEYILQEEI